MEWGYSCSSEEFEASALVGFARLAEDAGFDFVTVSDHFHPWTRAQGHSPYVWTTVGGIAASTQRVQLATSVTCPLIRQHPAIVAQAAATSQELSGGRFFLGVGTGEALNEHIIGERWPPIEQRQQMLVEAVRVMRALWTGETVDFVGEYFQIENAKLFSAPTAPIEVIWAAGGEVSAGLAAEHADGLWCTRPDPDTIAAYRDAGGDGRIIGQLTVCWNEDAETARTIAHERWPNAALGGQLSQDLPTWTHFEQATKLATPEDVAERVVCGADPQAVVDAVDEFRRAGVNALHFHQVGDDQAGFIGWWQTELRAALDVRARR